ncbi:MAG: PEP-CTERM sorting domain-containing protein [Planctomycetota bacterium]
MNIARCAAASATLVALASPAAAQSVINGIDAAFEGNDYVLGSVNITRDGFTQTISVADMLGISVTSFVGSTLPFENTILSTPLNLDSTPSAPAIGQRAAVLGDILLNSAIQNPNGDDGLGFAFNGGGLVNGPGADIILFDIGAAPGAPVPGPDGPGTLVSPGGDPFTVAGAGADAGLSTDIASDQYVQIGADDLFSGNTGFFNNLDTFPITDLDELENTPLNAIPLPPTFPLTGYAVLIDLSDLGFAEGSTVTDLTLKKFGSDFGIDPAFIAGLPQVPAPTSAALLALAATGAAARRRR